MYFRDLDVYSYIKDNYRIDLKLQDDFYLSVPDQGQLEKFIIAEKIQIIKGLLTHLFNKYHFDIICKLVEPKDLLKLDQKYLILFLSDQQYHEVFTIIFKLEQFDCRAILSQLNIRLQIEDFTMLKYIDVEILKYYLVENQIVSSDLINTLMQYLHLNLLRYIHEKVQKIRCDSNLEISLNNENQDKNVKLPEWLFDIDQDFRWTSSNHSRRFLAWCVKFNLFITARYLVKILNTIHMI